jgi:hypothetical protein
VLAQTAAPSSKPCQRSGGRRGWAAPYGRVGAVAAKHEPSSSSPAVATSVPLTAVKTGPKRTTTDNATATSTCVFPPLQVTILADPIWLGSRVVSWPKLASPCVPSRPIRSLSRRGPECPESAADSWWRGEPPPGPRHHRLAAVRSACQVGSSSGTTPGREPGCELTTPNQPAW